MFFIYRGFLFVEEVLGIGHHQFLVKTFKTHVWKRGGEGRGLDWIQIEQVTYTHLKRHSVSFHHNPWIGFRGFRVWDILDMLFRRGGGKESSFMV